MGHADSIAYLAILDILSLFTVHQTHVQLQYTYSSSQMEHPGVWREELY